MIRKAFLKNKTS